jgi:tetratricopeptide (TPR) repeat protein
VSRRACSGAQAALVSVAVRLFPLLLIFAVACGHPPTVKGPALPSPGKVHRKIATPSAEAQRHFDLGLAHAYGFNFDEAQYEFLTALHEDPDCAMCMWGVAYCAGSNINEREKRWPGALEAAQKARALAKDPVERALADALIARYAPPEIAQPTTTTPKSDDRHGEHPTPTTPVPTPGTPAQGAGDAHGEHGSPPAPSGMQLNHDLQDRAYADALRVLAQDHPEDDDAAILLAEALMLTVPSGAAYWPPKPVVAVTQAREALERVLARSPDHIGAIHFYIHLMEDGRERTKALPYADKLAGLAPGAGHLIHMASHLYLRVGRYAEAEDMNRLAMAADEALVRRMDPGSTYASFANHPAHFLWQTLLWEGKRTEAQQMLARIAPHYDMLATKNPNAVGLGDVMRAWTAVRFGDWDAALALPMPDRPVAAMATHYARGLAFVAKGNVQDARGELGGVNVDAMQGPMAKRMAGVAEVARLQLEGAIEYANGDAKKALIALERAVDLEDKLDNPMEPPLWIFPARQRLGAILLAMGRHAEAADVYRKDLLWHPENGWSLYGLAKSLEALKSPEAPAVWKRFEKAWARSDVKLTSSVL